MEKKDLTPPTCIFKKFTDKFFGECHLLPSVSPLENVSVSSKNDQNYFRRSSPIGDSMKVKSSKPNNLSGEAWY